MNTDKTLKEKFANSKKEPIWYYKELEEVDIDYVIWNLIKEEGFVVEIDSDRYEVVFGKNRKHEIGQYIKNGDMNKESLSSYRVINEGFKKGKWFIITDRDTTDEFKKDYIKKKEDFAKKEKDMLYRDLLLSALKQMEDLSENQKKSF